MRIDEYLKTKAEREELEHEEEKKTAAELNDAIDALRIVGVEVDENVD